MEIKTEADDVDEGVNPRELRPLSGIVGSTTRWNSPKIRKKLRAAISFQKSISP